MRVQKVQAMHLRRAALAAEVPSVEGKLPTEFRIFKRGAISTRKGTFTFDERAAEMVLAASAEWGNEYHFDYEHGAMSPGGQPAPAAGWFKVELRNGELWAVGITWTERATAMLKAREIRYWSPTFFYDDEGRITELVNVALTNLPATDRIEPLAANRTGAAGGAPLPPKEEKPPMKNLLAALSLAETATEGDALSAFGRIKDDRQAMLSLTGKQTAAEALGVIQGWKAGAEKVVELSQKVAQMEAEKQSTAIEAKVKELEAAGKLAPSMLSWARTQTLEGLNAFGAVAVPLVTSRATPTGSPTGAGSEAVVTPEDEQLGRASGTDPKLIAASRARLAGKPLPRGSFG